MVKAQQCNPPDFGDGAMTVAQALVFSGIGRTRLYRLMADGELPYARVGTRRLIPRRALVDLLTRSVDRQTH